MKMKQPQNQSFLFLSQTGCLLPLLISINLFFGWMLFKPIVWLSVGGILILLFVINAYIMIKRVSRFSGKRNDVVDVAGEVVEDKKKLK